MPPHIQIDLEEQKITQENKFYRPHIAHAKQNAVLKGKHYILTHLFVFSIGHYFPFLI